ncbi:MAG TPA: ArsA-related P-loop ATPase, partial [Planctomycetota bacterium]|nr:ArsA-related P-loop ATPase [Planctomycetota bacterium]
MSRADASAPLAQVLAGKRLVVLVGQGGVGKTSVSAAIAYSRAQAGGQVAVLTIDPAPRLGDALGLPSIDAEPREVVLPSSARGTLTAMRLDTKSTFDRMVEQHAPSRERAAALLAHPLYRSISAQLGGTEAYMAFQRLHELHAAGTHDCLVVDTPPAANAAQLLAAPSRLSGLLDTGALPVLADPARVLSRAGGTIARTTLWLLLSAVERVTGASLRKGVGEFVELAEGLVSGLEQR